MFNVFVEHSIIRVFEHVNNQLLDNLSNVEFEKSIIQIFVIYPSIRKNVS